MKPSAKTALLLLLTLGLTLSPMQPTLAYDSAPNADTDACCSCPADTCESDTCGSGPDQHDDDCCEAGCHECSLPCCAGSAVILANSQTLDAILAADGCLAANAIDIAWVDADPLYHPPRS